MKSFIKSGILPLTVAITTLASNVLVAEDVSNSTTELTNNSCSYNKTTPIIPDGNIASKDELISAQTRIKLYQESLQEFRDCLLAVEKTLDPDADNFTTITNALHSRSDESVTLERKVADEFNQAVKIYKSR